MDQYHSETSLDADKSAVALAIVWAWCTLSMAVVGLRIYTRVAVVRQLGVDDYFMMLTLVFNVQFSTMFTAYALHGGCRHISSLSDSQKVYVLRLNWVSQPFCVLALVTGKVSVALLILRMLVKVQKWQRWFLYFAITTITAVGLVNCVLQFGQCSPPRALWTPSLAGKARCWAPEIMTTYAMGASSYLAFVDVALAALPATIIWSLQLTQQKKLALCMVLGTGVFAAICAIYKVTKFPEQSARTDLTWHTVSLYIWMVNETNVVIIAASIPTIQPFFVTHWRVSRTALTRSRYTNVSDEQVCISANTRPSSGRQVGSDGPIPLEFSRPDQIRRISKIIDVEIGIA